MSYALEYGIRVLGVKVDSEARERCGRTVLFRAPGGGGSGMWAGVGVVVAVDPGWLDGRASRCWVRRVLACAFRALGTCPRDRRDSIVLVCVFCARRGLQGGRTMPLRKTMVSTTPGFTGGGVGETNVVRRSGGWLGGSLLWNRKRRQMSRDWPKRWRPPLEVLTTRKRLTVRRFPLLCLFFDPPVKLRNVSRVLSVGVSGTLTGEAGTGLIWSGGG